MNVIHEPTDATERPGYASALQNRILRQYELQVADWQETCRDLSVWEDTHLVEFSTEEYLAEHAAIINELERIGLQLSSAAQVFGVEESCQNQIELTLQDLRDARALWHEKVSKERQSEILRSSFNES